jgi:hypothetical protein
MYLAKSGSLSIPSKRKIVETLKVTLLELIDNSNKSDFNNKITRMDVDDTRHPFENRMFLLFCSFCRNYEGHDSKNTWTFVNTNLFDVIL